MTTASTTLAAVILAVSSVADAGADDLASQLKSSPASQWELGVLRLRLATHSLGQQYKNARIGSTPFKLSALSVAPKSDLVYITVLATGPARKLSRDYCGAVIDRIRSKLDTVDAARIAWPGQLGSDALIRYAAKITARENSDLSITCEN